jgi:hypothetical protein
VHQHTNPRAIIPAAPSPLPTIPGPKMGYLETFGVKSGVKTRNGAAVRTPRPRLFGVSVRVCPGLGPRDGYPNHRIQNQMVPRLPGIPTGLPVVHARTILAMSAGVGPALQTESTGSRSHRKPAVGRAKRFYARGHQRRVFC